MNVLLISFSFPPAGGVGVLRALSLAKYLPEQDVRVDVLCARNAPAVGRDTKLLAQVPESVTVHRTWTLDLPFGVRKLVKKLLTRGGRSGGAAHGPQTAAPAKSSRGNPLKQIVANLLLPDPQIGWLPFATRAAARIVRRRNIDAVVITVPPFSSVILAKRLRKLFPSLPIVVDFRDEWLDTTLSLVMLNKNERAREVATRTEREAVEAASAVVLVTEAAQRALRTRYPGQPASKFHCISNGFDRPVPPAPADPVVHIQTPRAMLTYMGSVYGSTDPSTLVEAVELLPQDLRAKLRLRFIGHIETPALRATLARLGDTVELVGFLPHGEAVQALSATDFVLLISHDPVNVSAKLYDYLGSGKPIVAAVHPDGDVRRRIEETRAGWWADARDPAAIRDMLERILSEAEHGQLRFDPDSAAIAHYHRRPLAAEYAGLLQSLTGTDAA